MLLQSHDASWTAQALFAWTRTHDEPGKSGTCGYIAAGSSADVSSRHCATARFWTVGAKASHGNGRLLDACYRVFARCAKKKISTLSLRAAVENGSFGNLHFHHFLTERTIIDAPPYDIPFACKIVQHFFSTSCSVSKGIVGGPLSAMVTLRICS